MKLRHDANLFEKSSKMKGRLFALRVSMAGVNDGWVKYLGI